MTNLTYDRINRFEPKTNNVTDQAELRKAQYRDELKKQVDEKNNRRIEEQKRIKMVEELEYARYQKIAEENRPVRPQSNILPLRSGNNDIIDHMAKLNQSSNIQQAIADRLSTLSANRPQTEARNHNPATGPHISPSDSIGGTTESDMPFFKPPVNRLNQHFNTVTDINDNVNNNRAFSVHGQNVVNGRKQEMLDFAETPIHSKSPSINNEPQLHVFQPSYDPSLVSELKTHILVLKE